MSTFRNPGRRGSTLTTVFCSGVWNETEAWPLMFRSVDSIKALPLLDTKPSWLPVNLAASAIAELVLAAGREAARPSTGSGHAQVYHVLNPRVANWQDVLDGLKLGGLQFETLDRREWVKRLAASDPDVAKNPTYKLLVRLTFPSHQILSRPLPQKRD